MLGPKIKDVALVWNTPGSAHNKETAALNHSVLQEGKYGIPFQMENKKKAERVCQNHMENFLKIRLS